MLDSDKFGLGNRPHWEMKEGRAPSRYPDLIKSLKRNQILVGDDIFLWDTRPDHLVPAEEQYRRRLFLSKCEKAQIFVSLRNR